MSTGNYSSKAEQILDAAEAHMRRGGFGAASFRDLAADVGIKSASVHYHFPQKASLGVAVVHRYASRLLTALGAPDDPSESASTRVERLCGLYRGALMDDQAVCLCCVLGAEIRDIPAPVAAEVKWFYLQVLQWTEIALGEGQRQGVARLSAAELVSALHGAMVLAMAVDQPARFDEVVSGLTQRVR